MRKRYLLPLVGVVVLAMSMMPAHAASSVSASDTTNTTIEPILVKADAQVNNATFRTSALNQANVTGFTLSAASGFITASITTASALPRCTAVPCGSTAPVPYGGSHVMVLFQTDELEQQTAVGCSNVACTGDAFWTPRKKADHFYWFMYYGLTSSEQEPDVALGVYDPSGRIQGLPLEPGIGQTFGTQGQKYTGCTDDHTLYPQSGTLGNTSNNLIFDKTSSFSADGKTVTLKIPYEYKWRLAQTNSNPCGFRHKVITHAGGTISNAVAFSWMDHEIGGPDPVGLILGWTWYTDSVPKLGSTTPGGYKVGTPAGDPNPAGYAGPSCPLVVQSVKSPVDNSTIFAGGQVNPLYTGAPCIIPNPVGPGFVSSGLNLIAA